MAQKIFQNPTKTIPKSDSQIVRVDMTKDDVSGRNVPSGEKATNLAVKHVKNNG